nr:DNA methyltransferase [Caudoviricetes sp.]CAI9751750.1 DNA methyltransferase [Caudoviricetes sp.]
MSSDEQSLTIGILIQNLMKTSLKQTSQNGEGKSMFSPEDSPANHSRSQVEEKERRMTAISGHICFVQSGRFSQIGSLVRTLMESSRWFSPAKRLKWQTQIIFSKKVTYTERFKDTPLTKSAKVLSEKVIKSNRLLFRLVPLVRPTDETECGLSHTAQTQGKDLLPTPNAMDIQHKDMSINKHGRRESKNGKTSHSLGLEDMAYANLLPTPTALDRGSGRINKSPSPGASERPTLAMAARMDLLPTPMASDIQHRKRVQELKEAGATEFQSRKNGASRPNGLMDYLNFHDLMPTPSARDWKGCTTPGQKKQNGNVYGETLPDRVKRMTENMMWGGNLMPTPTATDWTGKYNMEAMVSRSGINRKTFLRNLPTMIENNMDGWGFLLTPQASDAKRCNMNMDVLKNHKKKKGDPSKSNFAEQVAHKIGGGASQLNPQFVEEMMGYPLMYTALPFLSPNGAKKR